MPDASLVASAAGSGIPSSMDALNSFMTLGNNIQSQMWSKKMYKLQRRDALEFWGMQNAYNSPQAQMQRYQAAGLNPALMYGQGNSGNASSIATPDVQPVNFRAPIFEGGKMDVMANLLAQADLRIKGAQANNLETQTEVIRQDAALRAYQAEGAGFDLAFKKEMRPFSADALREQVRSTRTQTDLAVNRDAREAAMNSSNLTEALERMASMREQRSNTILDRSKTYSDIRRNSAETARIQQNIELLKKDGTLRDWEIELSKRNLRPGDPMWVRMVTDFLSDFMHKLPSEVKMLPGSKH